jgi:hypothetical protein
MLAQGGFHCCVELGFADDRGLTPMTVFVTFPGFFVGQPPGRNLSGFGC